MPNHIWHKSSEYLNGVCVYLLYVLKKSQFIRKGIDWLSFRESLGRSVDGKCVYAKTMDGEIVCVSTQGNEFKELWLVDAGLGYEHAPCIVLEHKGVVYAGSRRGILAAIDVKTKQLLWRQQVGASEVNGFEVDKNGDIYASLVEGSVWRISHK